MFLFPCLFARVCLSRVPRQGGVRGTSWVYGNLLHPSLVGTTSFHLAHVTDWLPTLVEAAGGRTAPWPKPLDGKLPMDKGRRLWCQ
jgi:hypothetical protein